MIPVLKDHEDVGVNRLLNQFRDKPKIEAFLKSFLKQSQKTEDDLFDLLDQRAVDTATGATLDVVGKLVGAKRNGRSDTSYRESILLTILLNSNEGTPDNLLEILSLLTGAELVALWEHFPVSCIFYTNGTNVNSNLAQALTEASPITSGKVGIIHDPDNNAFIPATLGNVSKILIDNDGNEVVDNDGNNILVNGLAARVVENSWRSVPATLNGEVTQFGIPAHIYF